MVGFHGTAQDRIERGAAGPAGVRFQGVRRITFEDSGGDGGRYGEGTAMLTDADKVELERSID
jgi:hypothetical protein